MGALLDHLRASHAADADPGYWYELALNLRWLADRIVKKVALPPLTCVPRKRLP